jgi:uncharacterized membrane protein YhaH (DUF805 family)
MLWLLKCFRRYAQFQGRAGFNEWGAFTLFVIGAQVSGLGLDIAMGWEKENLVGWMKWYPTFEISRMLLILPFLAVSARRLHDTGESGWKTLLWLVPVLGWYFLLPHLVKDGDPNPNAFGPPEEEAPQEKARF